MTAYVLNATSASSRAIPIATARSTKVATGAFAPSAKTSLVSVQRPNGTNRTVASPNTGTNAVVKKHYTTSPTTTIHMTIRTLHLTDDEFETVRAALYEYRIRIHNEADWTNDPTYRQTLRDRELQVAGILASIL